MKAPQLPLESFPGRLLRGHRVASGMGGDPRFPGGTLAMQVPHFRALGLDLGGYFLGTLNVSIAPLAYRVIRPRLTFRQVAWHPVEPAEDFSFFDAAIRQPGGDWVGALVYRPHPETKPAHFQPPDTLEIVAGRWMPGLSYGDAVEIWVNPEQLWIGSPV